MKNRLLAMLFASALMGAGAPSIEAAAPAEAKIHEIDRGGWWGFEFLTCMATGLSDGDSLSKTASQCAAETWASRERELGQIIKAWWGFEF